jgi:hypothetical protein
MKLLKYFLELSQMSHLPSYLSVSTDGTNNHQPYHWQALSTNSLASGSTCPKQMLIYQAVSTSHEGAEA